MGLGRVIVVLFPRTRLFLVFRASANESTRGYKREKDQKREENGHDHTHKILDCRNNPKYEPYMVGSLHTHTRTFWEPQASLTTSALLGQRQAVSTASEMFAKL